MLLRLVSSVSSPLVRATGDILIILVSLCYATVAPLILPCAFIYFTLAYFVRRYSICTSHAPQGAPLFFCDGPHGNAAP